MPRGGQPCAPERGISAPRGELGLERIECAGTLQRLPMGRTGGDGGEVVPGAPVLVVARERAPEIAPGGGVAVRGELALARELERVRRPRHPALGTARGGERGGVVAARDSPL